MIWKQKTFNGFEEIAKTGFLTSISAYVLFWLMDLIRPGFVSRYFSVHLFLLTALIFGGLWASLIDEYIERAWIQWVVAFISGFPMAVLIWFSAEGLEGYRIPVVMISFFIPLLILRVLRT
jgi:hypothetical protein